MKRTFLILRCLLWKAEVANLFSRRPHSRLPGYWRAGYSAIYVTYAKLVVNVYCITIMTMKSHHFVYIFVALIAAKCWCGRRVSKRQAAANAVTLMSTVGNVVLEKNVESILWAGLYSSAGRTRPAGPSILVVQVERLHFQLFCSATSRFENF